MERCLNCHNQRRDNGSDLFLHYKWIPTTILNKYLLQFSVRCKERGIVQTWWNWAFDSRLNQPTPPFGMIACHIEEAGVVCLLSIHGKVVEAGGNWVQVVSTKKGKYSLLTCITIALKPNIQFAVGFVKANHPYFHSCLKRYTPHTHTQTSHTLSEPLIKRLPLPLSGPLP